MTICTGCGEQCQAVERDYGIGAYEYWGFRGYDTNVQTVSDCCEQPVRYEEPARDEEEVPF